jgi:exopolyphosphatase/guanosine-5'-triphosphate,3'-diphosphate pyrophosphatase
MAGFTDRERFLIAALCRYHRKALPNPVHGLYQALSADERKMLLMLIPILRLADNLDRSGDQRIQGIDCRLHNGDVVLQVRAKGDIDLEQWGAERAGEAFQQIYQRPVTVVKAKD